MRIEEKTKEILKAGVFIESYGNWALTKEQALKAIDALEEAGIGILGGDVYERIRTYPF